MYIGLKYNIVRVFIVGFILFIILCSAQVMSHTCLLCRDTIINKIN